MGAAAQGPQRELWAEGWGAREQGLVGMWLAAGGLALTSGPREVNVAGCGGSWWMLGPQARLPVLRITVEISAWRE